MTTAITLGSPTHVPEQDDRHKAQSPHQRHSGGLCSSLLAWGEQTSVKCQILKILDFSGLIWSLSTSFCFVYNSSFSFVTTLLKFKNCS